MGDMKEKYPGELGMKSFATELHKLLDACKRLANQIEYDSTPDAIITSLVEIIHHYDPDFLPESLKDIPKAQRRLF